MRVLVLHAHPVAESFNGALHRLIVERLRANGHDVDDCDLYAEAFDPLLTRDERMAYHDTAINCAPVRAHVERIRAADALILCYPVWNYGFPAILKGYLDRVFLPGVSFELRDGKVRPNLHNIRTVVTVTSYGGSRFRAMLVGDPPRKMVTRVLRLLVRPGARVRYLAHYKMNLSTDVTRSRFMQRVARTLDAM